ncbi:hypothetical protein OESDEN_11141 [Oesophagostomum dentatum]|uniref:GRAM domain-containing protein n=1 Tax=Oesophagostomum dentatum TaxID=61180 RepID=A0A0B1T0U3_OESDE|nr:hypothetical protein OESDEN_11141 [Oesophagostomum dentatum]
MNDKERSFPKGISSGILYLTENALIYRSKSINEDRAPTIMLFTDIISIKRIQSLRTMRLLAGTRKSLEISMEGRKKPLQFIGLAQRDDFFERIESVCARVDARIHFL